MNQTIFFDEILQIYLSEGNFHLVLGCDSGEISPKGKDIKQPIARLVIPKNALLKVIPELATAVRELIQVNPDEFKNDRLERTNDSSEGKSSYEGDPIVYKF